jgi:hypothetical protein
MVYNSAFCILSTGSFTWVHTVISNACPVCWTLCTEHTFWSTSCVWISLKFSLASTYTILALCICTTGGWITWIVYCWFSSCKGEILDNIWHWMTCDLYTFISIRFYKNQYSNISLRGSDCGKQLVKGSPVYPSWHVHTGI